MIVWVCWHYTFAWVQCNASNPVEPVIESLTMLYRRFWREIWQYLDSLLP